ncbi:universal stress protein, partial [Klebsiella pneumoniae]|uniref:universal stress protein n=1 Tax=Klebsiella pneumoniae TaxID=573 RepID=UPI001FB42105
GTVCVVGKIRDLILQLSKSSIYSTKPSDARKMEDHLLNTAKEKLSELVKKNGLAEDASHLYVRSGNVRDQVIALADELKADVVIVGSRNPGIQTHLLGSEAANIVRYAHVPVFVVR